MAVKEDTKKSLLCAITKEMSFINTFTRKRSSKSIHSYNILNDLSTRTYDTSRRKRALLSTEKHDIEIFPQNRYLFLRKWNNSNVFEQGKSGGLTWFASMFITQDTWTQKEVFLTLIPKTHISSSQVKYLVDLYKVIGRSESFLVPLEKAYQTQNHWVLKQDLLHDASTLEEQILMHSFAEQQLKAFAFWLVSLLWFLHTHNLSLEGRFSTEHIVVLPGEDKRFVLRLPFSLILYGGALVPLTPAKKSKDIRAIGKLLWRLCAEMQAPLSETCTRFLHDCLYMSNELQVYDLFSRKWFDSFQHRHYHRLCGLEHGFHRVPHHNYHAEHHTLSEPQRLKLLRHFMSKPSSLSGNFLSLVLSWSGSTNQNSSADDPGSLDDVFDELERHRMDSLRHQRYEIRGRKFGGLHRTSSATALIGSWLKRNVSSGANPWYLTTSMRSGSSRDGGNLGHLLLDVQRKAPHSTNSVSSMTKAPVHQIHKTSSSSIVSYQTFDYAQTLSEEEEEETADITSSVEYDTFEDDYLEDTYQTNRFRKWSLDKTPIYRSVPTLFLPTALDEQESSFGIVGQVDEQNRQKEDAVHFSAFGPECIQPHEPFRLDIWAYLRQQRDDMLEEAKQKEVFSTSTSFESGFPIKRGQFVTIWIQSSDKLQVLGEESKSFQWTGTIGRISFELLMSKPLCENLCTARILVGTKVFHMYIRLKASSSFSSLSTSNCYLESHLEHVVSDLKHISMHDLEIVRPIGSGHFGDAILAKWNQENVVLKTLRGLQGISNQGEVVGGELLQKEFEHEAAIMHMVGKHPNVVQLYGITEGDNTMGLVTEYLPRGNLHDLLVASASTSNSSTLSLYTKTLMAKDVASGLVNIHQGLIVHRDIAARNCLVDTNFHLKVCDFGLSRRFTPQPNQRQQQQQLEQFYYFDDVTSGYGPLKWMAPESLVPPYCFSPCSDSYMYGVLLYELFTEQNPFSNLSPKEAACLILEGKHVPIPSWLPSTHQKLMKDCFESHPLARPSMQQIVQCLDEWIISCE